RLRHTHHRVVNRLVAVRVVLADHLADYGGALLVRGTWSHAGLVHGVEDASLHRLEAVAYVRQGPLDDYAHGVVEVRRAHLLFDLNGADVADRESFQGHGISFGRKREVGRKTAAGGRNVGGGETALIYIL